MVLYKNLNRVEFGLITKKSHFYFLKPLNTYLFSFQLNIVELRNQFFILVQQWFLYFMVWSSPKNYEPCTYVKDVG